MGDNEKLSTPLKPLDSPGPDAEGKESTSRHGVPGVNALALLQEGRFLNDGKATATPSLPKFDGIADKPVDNKQPGEELFSAEKISKIVKISVTKDGIKSHETLAPKDGEPLDQGDYKIYWKVGKDPKSSEDIERAALLHIPEGKNLGMLVLVPGVSNKDQLSENYLMETHLHELADEGKEKYAVLTLLTEKRVIGPESKTKGVKSSAWITDGCFLHPDVVEQLRLENKERTGMSYDDRDYVAGILKASTKLAPVDPNRSNWGFVGGSQGGALITRLCGDERFCDIANIYIVGSSAEAEATEIQLADDKYRVSPYKINDTNAQHVLIFQHRNDTLALPHPDKLDLVKTSANIAFLHRKVVDLGLAAFDNLHQNPLKLESIYLRDIDKSIGRHLGESTQHTMKAYVPAAVMERLRTRQSFNQELKTKDEMEQARKEGKNLLYSYFLKRQNGEGVIVDIYDLPANHVIAGRSDGSTSLYKKYDGVDESRIIDQDLEARLSKKNSKAAK